MDEKLPAKPPSLRDADWLNRPETRELFAALNDGGHTARAVGGAVRNTLLGTPVHDVDIATTSPPDVTASLAAKAGLRSIPTGIDHGTVTVVVRHTPFEVTTLRTDVETFGRHARVAYTDDWAADARRRDFTINALYCDADGVILDPLDGYADLVARRVRFIGKAEERIREDYLRILRFFRFSAEYAGGVIDGDGLKACRASSHGLDQLSRERIRAELLRLVVSPHVTAVVPVIASDFLTRVFPDAPDVRLLERVVTIEHTLNRQADPILRLGALSGAKPGGALPLRDALRLSAREFERLARLSMPDPAFRSSEHGARRQGIHLPPRPASFHRRRHAGLGSQRSIRIRHRLFRASRAPRPMAGPTTAGSRLRRDRAWHSAGPAYRPHRCSIRGLVDRRGLSGRRSKAHVATGTNRNCNRRKRW